MMRFLPSTFHSRPEENAVVLRCFIWSDIMCGSVVTSISMLSAELSEAVGG
jgi:hypothetical protein